jgi:hypothetical protein
VIVENDDKVLLERHFKPGLYDFRVAPVGGTLGDKDPRATASTRIDPKSRSHS